MRAEKNICSGFAGERAKKREKKGLILIVMRTTHWPRRQPQQQCIDAVADLHEHNNFTSKKY